MRSFCVVLLLSLVLLSCESLSVRHSTRAILFKGDDSALLDKRIYRPAQDKSGSFYSSNPIFIHNNTKFSVKIDEVNPGWLYKAEPKNPTNNTLKSSPGKGQNYQTKNSDPISESQFNHYRGHELWLLTTISSLNNNDPLETKSKRYFKATNVKFDSESYSIIPLDSDEKYIFTHESDSSYRIKFQLYSVNGFAVKKELAKISNNPGVIGTLEALGTTLKNTVGSLAGNAIQSLWEEKASEGMALERFLLSLNATEEFHGELVVLRDGDFNRRDEEVFLKPEYIKPLLEASNLPGEQKNAKLYEFPKPFVENSYLFLDLFKSEDNDCTNLYGKHSKSINFNSEYKEINISVKNVEGNGEVSIPKKNCLPGVQTEKMSQFGYVKLSVLESYNAKSFVNQSSYVSAPNKYLDIMSNLKKAVDDNPLKALKSDVSKLQKERALLVATCSAGDSQCKNSLDEIDASIGTKSNEIKKIEIVPGIEDALNKYNVATNLAEWTAHLERPLD